MTTLPQYKIVRTIGHGTFGYVFEAFDKTRKTKVALKRIEKVGSYVSRQYQILDMIKGCKNVVKLEDFFYTKTDDGRIIQNIVLQFAESSLQKVMEKHRSNNSMIPLKRIKGFAFQILKGLAYIHSKNICHRDLKPENILLTKEGVVKICDFGSSKVINKSGKNTPYIVSRYYRAPELIVGICNYSTSVDIWSAGCILAELFILKTFLKGQTQADQLYAAIRKLGPFTAREKSAYLSRIPFDKNLINDIDEGDEIDDLEDFKDMPEQELLNDLIRKMMKYLPQQRITAEEAMKHPFFNEIKQNASKE